MHLAVGIEDGREIVGDVELADDHVVQEVVKFVHRLEKVLDRRLQVGELFLILQKLVVLCLRKNGKEGYYSLVTLVFRIIRGIKVLPDC